MRSYLGFRPASANPTREGQNWGHGMGKQARVLRCAALFFCAALSACATTTLTVRHSPLYQVGGGIATITAKAANSSDGIAGIDIIAVTGKETDCTELGMLPSAIPCETNLVQTSTRCNFANN